jgi:hypothetical protein
MFLAAIVAFHTQSLSDTAGVARMQSTSKDVAVDERERESRADGASLEVRSGAPLKSV